MSRRHVYRGSTLGSGFQMYMYRVDLYVRVVICPRREYNKIIIIIISTGPMKQIADQLSLGHLSFTVRINNSHKDGTITELQRVYTFI